MSILAFSTNVCHIEGNLPGNTVLPFQKPTILTIFGIFSILFSTQNENLARFARNLKKILILRKMLQFRFDSVYDKKISEMILIHCVFKKEEKERKAKEAEASAA